MADVAELGISVKAEGFDETAAKADKLTASLKDTTGETKNLEKAQNDLSTAFAKQEALKSAGQAYTALGGATKEFVTAQKATSSAVMDVERALAATAPVATSVGQSTSLLSRILGGLGNAFKASTVEAGSFGAAHTALRDTMRAFSVGLREAGGNLGIFGQVLSGARTGFIAMAAVAGTVFVAAIEKASDAIVKIKDNLSVLAGTSASKAFETIKSSALDAKAALQEVYDLTIKLATITFQKPQTFVSPGGENFENQSKVIDTLIKGLQLGGVTATQAGKAVDDFLSKVDTASKKTGETVGLTGEMFRDILKISPQLAQAIARSSGAFGDNLQQLVKFSQELDKNPKTLAQLEQILKRIDPEISKIFSTRPANLSQAFDRLTTSVGNLFSVLGTRVGIASAFDSISQGFNKLADNITKGGIVAAFNELFKIRLPSIFFEFVNTIERGLATPFAAAFAAISTKFSELWTGAKEAFSTTMSGLGEILQNAFNTAIGAVKNLFMGLWNSLPEGARTALTAIGGVVSSIVQTVVNGVMQMVNAAIAALNALRSRQAAPNLQSVNTGGYSQGPSFDASAIANQFDQSNPDFNYGYATGGAFQVTGTGGVDSVPVRFMASPGELVTITPADLSKPRITNATTANIPSTTFTASGIAQGAGVGATAPASAITSPITFAVRDSTGKIVGAVNDATAAIEAMAKNTAATAAATTTAPSGGGATRVVFDPGPNAKAGSAAAPLGSGPVDAYGNVVRPGQFSYVTRINQNSAIAGSAPGGSGQMVYALNPNYAGFATGGSFMVPGSGATDSIPIKFMATPGERITVTPVGKTGFASGGTFTIPGISPSDQTAAMWALNHPMATTESNISGIGGSATILKPGGITVSGPSDTAISGKPSTSASFGLQTALDQMSKESQRAATVIQQLFGQMVDTQRNSISQRSGKDRPIIVNIMGANNPMAFLSSESQIKRTIRRAFA